MQPLAHAEAIGDWAIDVEGFARNFSLAVSWQGVQCSHVVEAIREFYQDHADVATHGKKHFAKVLRLFFFLGLELNLADLADTIDQLRDFFTEVGGNLLFGGFRVFDYIVQDRGRDALRIKVHTRENTGDFDGVVDVRLAAAPQLPFVRLRPEQVSAVNVSYLIRLEISLQCFA